MINAFPLKVALLKISDTTDEYGKQRFEINSSKEMMAIPITMKTTLIQNQTGS